MDYASKAFDALASIAEDTSASDDDRVRAASILLDHADRRSAPKKHYTSKPWHVIDGEGDKLVIRCDTSYATDGVMELVIDKPA